jgi:hypothetical protein
MRYEKGAEEAAITLTPVIYELAMFFPNSVLVKQKALLKEAKAFG